MVLQPPLASKLLQIPLLTAVSLFILRLVCASLAGTIHPDEHLQLPEVAATLALVYDDRGDGPLQTWEWTTENPVRSVVPVWITLGALFKLLNSLIHVSPTTIFVSQRFFMFALSYLDNLLISKTDQSSSISTSIFNTSPALLVFLLRPFSNTLETTLLAGLFVTFSQILSNRTIRWKRVAWSGLFGVILALGTWTRITFVAFALPSCVMLVIYPFVLSSWTLADPSEKLKLVKKDSSTPKRESLPFSQALQISLSNLGPLILAFVLSASLFIFVDSVHFSKGHKLVIAPLNALLYNTSTENLKQHGLHPRWLHVVVNMPMIFGLRVVQVIVGVAGIYNAASAIVKGKIPWSIFKSEEITLFFTILYHLSIMVPLLLLSLLPHQEPRFLIPLIVPIALAESSLSGLKPDFWEKVRRVRPMSISANRAFRRIDKIIKSTTISTLHLILLTTVFSFLHQGGLVPTLLQLNTKIAPSNPKQQSNQTSNLEVIFWKTFMPPRSLLVSSVPKGETRGRAPPIHITDLSGSPTSILHSSLSHPQPPTARTLLVAPAYSFDLLPSPAFPRECFTEILRPPVGGLVHLDMDRLDELIAGGWGRRGLGVWEVASGCLRDLD
ncbi:hypothetical protein T439DRAFT_383572 [Meredithblackwellia eburnea MCA 4105]